MQSQFAYNLSDSTSKVQLFISHPNAWDRLWDVFINMQRLWRIQEGSPPHHVSVCLLTCLIWLRGCDCSNHAQMRVLSLRWLYKYGKTPKYWRRLTLPSCLSLPVTCLTWLQGCHRSHHIQMHMNFTYDFEFLTKIWKKSPSPNGLLILHNNIQKL